MEEDPEFFEAPLINATTAGLKAFYLGGSASDCPYEAGTREFDNWSAGWKIAAANKTK